MLKRILVAVVLLGVALVIYFLSRPAPLDIRERQSVGAVQSIGETTSTSAKPQGTLQRTAPSSLPEIEPPRGAPVAVTTPPAPSSLPQNAPGNAQATEEITGPTEELDNVQFMVRGYRDVLGENPVGTNLEITRALMGENARQVKMPLPIGSHLNKDGELTDRWGTPYFFHQISGKEMEVRSAGPDQKMWTRDDLITK